jgi:hypothetical protein
MHRIRSSVIAVLAATALVLPQTASAQQSFPQSLYWGSGLVDIPVAWVSPLTGDFAINYSGKNFETDPADPKINYSESINSQLVMSMSAWGRVELGFAAYSSNPEFGFFGKGVLLDQNQFGREGGIARWLLPSVALGFRNLGAYSKIDRFGIGYALLPDSGSPNYKHVPDSLHLGFDTAPTFYGVATKSFALNELRSGWPNVGLSLSVGYGNGLFSDDGGLEDQGISYAKHSTGGLFYGVSMDFAVAPNAELTVMAENNAWDYNAGLSLNWRGVRAGLYLTEIGAGSASPDTVQLGASYVYNYQKVAFTLGWQSNIFALLRGDFLQNRVAALERERQTLLTAITERQQRIAALELEINRYEAQNLLELEQRRAQAEAELRAEREALRRLEERLRRIEQQQQQNPPATPPR